jgi:hypothetical protein
MATIEKNGNFLDANQKVLVVNEEAGDALGVLKRSKFTFEVLSKVGDNTINLGFAGTIYEASGCTNFRKNNVAVTLPVLVTTTDQITYECATEGVKSIQLGISDTSITKIASTGAEYYSPNNTFIGYSQAYGAIITSFNTGVSQTTNAEIGIHTLAQLQLKALTVSGYYSNRFYGKKIKSNTNYDYFTGGSSLHRIDKVTKDVTTISNVGVQGLIVAVDDLLLVVSVSTTLSIINPITMVVLASNQAVTNNWVATAASKVYIATTSGTMQIRNTTGSILSTISSLTGVYWVEPYSTFIIAGGTNALWKINTATDLVTSTLVVNGSVRRILIEGDHAYFGTSTGYLYKVLLTDMSIVSSCQIGSDNFQYGITKVGDNIFLTTLGAEIIRINNCTTRTAYPVDFVPLFLDVNPSSNQIMAGGATSLAVFNYATLTA